MESLKLEIVAFVNSILDSLVTPIVVVGLVLAVGSIIFAGIKLILAKNSNEAIVVRENILYIFIGVAGLSTLLTLTGLIYTKFIK